MPDDEGIALHISPPKGLQVDAQLLVLLELALQAFMQIHVRGVAHFQQVDCDARIPASPEGKLDKSASTL